ncbi:enoyl-CoA hydratase/isomerase family protein [Parapusillimonas granuli]|uniref:Enoyl-CoA hydratase/isomerase family protein n=1 Tax=Parapusillimonas granuli TaxID=380911 RepID=A0A853FQ17_9BURK|nr:enoyl-CoA hydratase-related protein [Parapusillimonas granuli]MBB5216166.1 E-phenylitaconyl-CoA hydratase [Parapusillimonas granuli]MEB2400441.1 enoyl-CoA hydratase-related protein [Alcaligenaceae bacterium]NYT47845.1 enoyl-CoA hydratase/isomerase family protein [Parapusillimonas granuli]
MTIHHSIDRHVATIVLDAQAALNALTVEDLAAMRDLLVSLQDDDAVRAIVLTGAGEKAFCTGANLKKTMPPAAGFAQGAFKSRRAEAGGGGYTRLIDISDLDIWKPIIGAINGYCLGGGLELALQCDIRIASDNATFALPEVKVASVPAVGGVQHLMRAVGSSNALSLALTGDRIDADHALRIGLVSQVVPQAELAASARAIAERIAANGPLAVQAVKRLAQETSHMAPRDFIAQSNLQWGLLRDSRDRLEGRQAFAERRTPRYTGE